MPDHFFGKDHVRKKMSSDAQLSRRSLVKTLREFDRPHLQQVARRMSISSEYPNDVLISHVADRLLMSEHRVQEILNEVSRRSNEGNASSTLIKSILALVITLCVLIGIRSGYNGYKESTKANERFFTPVLPCPEMSTPPVPSRQSLENSMNALRLSTVSARNMVELTETLKGIAHDLQWVPPTKNNDYKEYLYMNSLYKRSIITMRSLTKLMPEVSSLTDDDKRRISESMHLMNAEIRQSPAFVLVRGTEEPVAEFLSAAAGLHVCKSMASQNFNTRHKIETIAEGFGSWSLIMDGRELHESGDVSYIGPPFGTDLWKRPFTERCGAPDELNMASYHIDDVVNKLQEIGRSMEIVANIRVSHVKAIRLDIPKDNASSYRSRKGEGLFESDLDDIEVRRKILSVWSSINAISLVTGGGGIPLILNDRVVYTFDEFDEVLKNQSHQVTLTELKGGAIRSLFNIDRRQVDMAAESVLARISKPGGNRRPCDSKATAEGGGKRNAYTVASMIAIASACVMGLGLVTQ